MNNHQPIPQSQPTAPVWPPLLQAGDTVAIVAPSSARSDMDQRVAATTKTLQTWGLKVTLGQHVYEKHYRFSGKDTERLAGLQHALDDTTAKAILVANGGHGATRIIDKIDFSRQQQTPKWIIGFSDTTTLLLKLHQLNIVSAHGPVGPHFTMAAQKASLDSLRQLLFHGDAQLTAPPHPLNRIDKAKAPVAGGNLTMICNNIGTTISPRHSRQNPTNRRHRRTSLQTGQITSTTEKDTTTQDIAGLIVGNFTDVHIDSSDPFARSVEHIVEEHVHTHSYTVAFNYPIGHQAPNLAFPHGATGHLHVEAQSTHLSFEKNQRPHKTPPDQHLSIVDSTTPTEYTKIPQHQNTTRP